MIPCVFCNDGQGVSQQDVDTGKAFAKYEWKHYSDLLHSAEHCMYCSVVLQAISVFLSPEEEPGLWKISRTWSSPAVLKITWTYTISLWESQRCVRVYLDPKPDDLQTCTKNPQYLEQICKWTHDCVGTHHACAKQARSYLPTRVLDVEQNDDSVVLHDTRPEDGGQYVALSHCWGHYTPIRTVSANITRFRHEIPIEYLPKTFRDAVYVTRQLRCKYLWIDSLCIIQNDKQDWAHEAARMADVYGNSLVTLAASSSEDCRGGLFHEYKMSDAQKTVEAQDSINGHAVKVKLRPVNHDPFEGGIVLDTHPRYQLPLFKRAWCFQEYLLSPRVLHFSQHELIWECLESKSCTCTPGLWQIAPTIKDRFWDSSATDLSELWWDLVEAFSTRDITVHSDLLPALAGLARTLSTRGLGEYTSGLWRKTLADDLGWELELSENSSRRSEDKSAPSWSWISVVAPVRMPLAHRSRYDRDTSTRGFEIVDIAGPDLSQDPFASISITTLTIRGKISAGIAHKVGKDNYYAKLNIMPGGSVNKPWIPDVVSEILQAHTLPCEVQILWIFARCGLVLKATTDKADTYRRLGVMLYASDDTYKYASRLESKVIHLV